MELPASFVSEMTGLFRRFGRDGETQSFLASFQDRPYTGLRANALKVSAADLRLELAAAWGIPESRLEPVKWSDDGFSFPAALAPGRLAYHAAGLYYIQEPSAMLPAMALAARPGERVLDLCAAPGGKSCKIAADLRGEGLLWANELSRDRAKALLHNIEQTGCANCVITTETPGRLADALPAFFDKILADAPCSGQGMFRRDPSAAASFLQYGSSHCAGLQRDILSQAWRMLKPGGVLAYSTCTFSLEENEEMVLWMLETFKDCRLDPIIKAEGVDDGFPVSPEMTGTARIWPHRSAGEGHFCALLRKKAETGLEDQLTTVGPADPAAGQASGAGEAAAEFSRFCGDHLTAAGVARINRLLSSGRLRDDRQNLHIVPDRLTLPGHLAVIKAGLYLGSWRAVRGGRLAFEPSHSFLLSLSPEDLRDTVKGLPGSDLVCRYLRGETLESPTELVAEPGRFTAVLLESLANTGDGKTAWPLGWAKTQAGGLLKNLVPKAWRFLS